ncbi:MAG: MaoC family dehydratase [Solirubrobacteraceae bacterium]
MSAPSTGHGTDCPRPPTGDRALDGTSVPPPGGPLVLRGAGEVTTRAGRELGVSAWTRVGQDRIDAFARCTGDGYWLHTDPVRAAEEPIGSTIAHGLLTLALGPAMTYEIVTFEGFTAGLNYGYERVRFVAPVPVDSRLRLRLRLAEAEETDGNLLLRLEQTFELAHQDRPACVAVTLLKLVA